MTETSGSVNRPVPLPDHTEVPPNRFESQLRSGPVQELIAQRAHRKWKEHGYKENAALQDLLDAEAEVQAEIRRGLRY